MLVLSSYWLTLQLAISLDLDFFLLSIFGILSTHFKPVLYCERKWRNTCPFDLHNPIKLLPVLVKYSSNKIFDWLSEQCKARFAQPHLCETLLYSKTEMKRCILSKIILQRTADGYVSINYFILAHAILRNNSSSRFPAADFL